jgi:ATP-dependent DNA helicase RecQ
LTHLRATAIVVVQRSVCEARLMTDLFSTLRDRFGHFQFREGQEPLVNAVLTGGDVLAVMPTGSGKSLGYQLPAVVLEGTMLVVSPLISLMKDQVDELTRRDIPAGGVALDDSRRSPARRRAAGPCRRVAAPLRAGPLSTRQRSRVVSNGAGFAGWWPTPMGGPESEP